MTDDEPLVVTLLAECLGCGEPGDMALCGGCVAAHQEPPAEAEYQHYLIMHARSCDDDSSVIGMFFGLRAANSAVFEYAAQRGGAESQRVHGGGCLYINIRYEDGDYEAVWANPCKMGWHYD